MLQCVLQRVTQVYRALSVVCVLTTLISCSTVEAARAQSENVPREPDAILLHYVRRPRKIMRRARLNWRAKFPHIQSPPT